MISSLISVSDYVFYRSGKFLTPECKWSSVEKKAAVFDSEKDAKKFLSGCRIKASLYATTSITSFRKLGSRSIVEYDSKFEKV